MTIWDHALSKMKGEGVPVREQGHRTHQAVFDRQKQKFVCSCGEEWLIHPVATCDLCWTSFPNDEELAQHREMEEMVDWPIDGMSEEPADA